MDLFTPLTIRDITFRNRVVVSPMCQYSCVDGFANDWHLVHLGSRAAGGAGLVFTEATAVEEIGRISPADLGIWKNEHIAPLARITAFLRQMGAVPGIQLAHAGRKASCNVPWEKKGAQLAETEGGWQTVAPSPLPFHGPDRPPHELTIAEIARIVELFAHGTRRALEAGFEVIEIHGAHGYLINEFLSPLSNHRNDEYGGTFESRIRFAVEVAQAVRREWPQNLPLFFRISASDWMEGGWSVEDSVALAKVMKGHGVDLFDCSSGGNSPNARSPVGPGYQVPFAEQVRRDAGIPTGAVGMITEAAQANQIIAGGQADLVLLAREYLRDPYWALHSAAQQGIRPEPPVQYARAY